MPLPDLTLRSYDDLDLLAMVEDHNDEDGWTDLAVITNALSFEGDDVHARRCVGGRFAYFSRMDLVERNKDDKEHTLYRLTDDGMAFVEGAALNKTQAKVLEGMTPAVRRQFLLDIAQEAEASSLGQRAVLRRTWQRTTLLSRNGRR